MPDYPKFLYCQNELHSAEDFVLHTQVPRFLAKKVDHELLMFEITWVDRPAYDEAYLNELMSGLKTWYRDYTTYLASHRYAL